MNSTFERDSTSQNRIQLCSERFMKIPGMLGGPSKLGGLASMRSTMYFVSQCTLYRNGHWHVRSPLPRSCQKCNQNNSYSCLIPFMTRCHARTKTCGFEDSSLRFHGSDGVRFVQLHRAACRVNKVGSQYITTRYQEAMYKLDEVCTARQICNGESSEKQYLSRKQRHSFWFKEM